MSVQLSHMIMTTLMSCWSYLLLTCLARSSKTSSYWILLVAASSQSSLPPACVVSPLQQLQVITKGTLMKLRRRRSYTEVLNDSEDKRWLRYFLLSVPYYLVKLSRSTIMSTPFQRKKPCLLAKHKSIYFFKVGLYSYAQL